MMENDLKHLENSPKQLEADLTDQKPIGHGLNILKILAVLTGPKVRKTIVFHVETVVSASETVVSASETVCSDAETIKRNN